MKAQSMVRRTSSMGNATRRGRGRMVSLRLERGARRREWTRVLKRTDAMNNYQKAAWLLAVYKRNNRHPMMIAVPYSCIRVPYVTYTLHTRCKTSVVRLPSRPVRNTIANCCCAASTGQTGEGVHVSRHRAGHGHRYSRAVWGGMATAHAMIL